MTKDLEQDQSIEKHHAHAESISDSLETKLKDTTAWLDQKFCAVCRTRRSQEESAKRIYRIDCEH